ncbi:ribokinase [Microbacterium aoyamense]|uniref:Ribokinase n=1 Tax=Microbacterium aoyamense TaxID=344166 RepID=A0ABN2PHW5_9MICO|nr:ribokinase [Microbacterium aoyamense]
MSSILVLGSANLDLVVRQPRIARPGETMFGTAFSTVPGGKGLNQAVAAARAGADVGFLGAVGDDEFGRRLRTQLETDGIDTTGLATVDQPTGTAHIAVTDDGENSIVVVSGANHVQVALDDTMRSAIEGARTLVLQLERPVSLVAEALAYAQAHGVRTVLTPAPVAPLPSDLLALVTVLVPNAREACELAGVDDEFAAARILGEQGSTVIITRGSRGVLVLEPGGEPRVLPAVVVEPVDTTGAGDTFTGALCAWLAEDASLDDAIRAGQVAAAISVTRPGATSAMPGRSEILAALG